QAIRKESTATARASPWRQYRRAGLSASASPGTTRARRRRAGDRKERTARDGRPLLQRRLLGEVAAHGSLDRERVALRVGRREVDRAAQRGGTVRTGSGVQERLGLASSDG